MQPGEVLHQQLIMELFFPGLTKTPMKIDNANGAPSVREIASLCARMVHRMAHRTVQSEEKDSPVLLFSFSESIVDTKDTVLLPFAEEGAVCIDRLHLRSVTTDRMRT